MTARVLTIAESDSSGGSGVQADIKTILALGGYATTVMTGVTAQNTTGIISFQMIDPVMVADQLRAVMTDIGTDVIKTGILNSEIIIDTVADEIDKVEGKIPVVIDPSMVAGDGSPLIDETGIAAMKRRLLIRATVLTPNLREAEMLTGMTIHDLDDMRHATSMMRSLGSETVVLKAGRALNDKIVYFVASDDGEVIVERPQIETRHTLGAGCTFSSAIAVSLAQGMGVMKSIERGLDFLHQAILHAPGFGQGRGPMNHAFHLEHNQTFFQPENIKVRKI